MITVSMRDKENADDYRFIPDPDLPPMQISDKQINDIIEIMPKHHITRQKDLKTIWYR